MLIIPKSSNSKENRVPVVPESVKRLVGSGLSVFVEQGAGENAGYIDEAYVNEGAEVVSETELYSKGSIIIGIEPPTDEWLVKLPKNSVYLSFLNALAHPEITHKLNESNITSFGFDLIPRITRAQSVDALSSQSNIAGYKSVLLAANYLPKFFPMLTTAAGTVIPAKVLVVGVGVAGLQAIATAKRLGAVVEAYDIRPEVKEQVESLGAKFVEIEDIKADSGEGGYAKEVDDRTKELLQKALAERVAASDAVITTALVPGKKAPVLISKDIATSMKEGSVIIDMAAVQGGNVEGSRPDEEVILDGVRIYGPTNLPSTVAKDASRLYSRNVENFLKLIIKDAKLNLNFDDEIIRGSCLTHEGKVVNERVASLSGKVS